MPKRALASEDGSGLTLAQLEDELPPSPAAESAPDEPPRSWIARAVVAVPDVILLPLLWLSVVTSATIILHAFTPWLVIPVTVAASVATWRWRPRFEVTRATARSSAVALIGIAVWLVGNIPFASSWLYVSQDPGFITLQGVWLSRHASPSLPAAQAAHIVAQIPHASGSTGSFTLFGDQLLIQGAKLVPGLLAIGGWVGGIHGVLVGNLVIGAIALLAVFALARRMAGPIWSVVATASLAVSMPFLVFTRGAYTEPAVLALTFGGLLLLLTAMKSGRWTQFLAGGALIGAGGLARIDGGAVVIGMTIGLAFVVAGARDDARRRSLRIGYFAATGAALVLTALGWLDLRLDSPQYLNALASQWHALFAGLAATFVVGAVIGLKHPWQWLRTFLARHARILGWALAGAVLIIAVVLISRPLWYVGHGVPNPIVSGLQAERGLPVDPTRTYDEQSVNWLAMYFSWIIVIGGFVGIAFALRRSVVKREANVLVTICTIAVPSLLYLWTVANTPEQLWVMRRYLPVTMPGLLLFAAWLTYVCIGWLGRNLTTVRLWVRRGAVVAAAAGFIFPLYTDSRTYLTAVTQYGGQLTQVRQICQAVDGRPVVLIDDGAWFPTVRTMCGVQAFETLGDTSTDQLKQILTAFGGQSPVVMTFVPSQMPWVDKQPAPTVNDIIWTWHPSLNERPQRADVGRQTIWLGTIDETGHVVPIPPVS